MAWPDPDDEYQDDLVDEYFERPQQTVAEAQEVLGRPKFHKGPGNPGARTTRTRCGPRCGRGWAVAG